MKEQRQTRTKKIINMKIFFLDLVETMDKQLDCDSLICTKGTENGSMNAAV